MNIDWRSVPERCEDMLNALASSDTITVWSKVLQLDSHGVKLFVIISEATTLSQY